MAGLCELLPGFLCKFPAFSDASIRGARKVIDDGFKSLVRSYVNIIDAMVQPLQWFLNYLERLFVSSPWPIILIAMLAIVYFGSRNTKITIGTAASMCAIGLLGLWNDTMVTLAMVTVCTLIAVIVGIPIGILMARSDRVQAFVNPILDVMQTMPSFVYLIPVVMIFGIGKVPGLIAVVIYAVPPMIRLTNLGIRLVDKEVLEAADAFGSSGWQKLRNVQMPLALPTIMAGINQTIMMSLAMVVVASMVGVGGLGKNVLQAINNQFFTVGFLNGFALVAIAIIFDRTSQAYGKRLQKHSEVIHG
ncbi:MULTISPECIES: proline/glycine betaine ABC transporter permease [unclassified Shinella]|uniref:ABC transporter permease n=1 Tax=unclassified Shinella TaxID=2643062 RepID=UPI00225D52C2|nr:MULTISPECIES: proline/glycine betaine ABC transporter permease [unclassified Shinella]CAI0338134.1 L-proline glycine betaine ABC transport system permease protein ProW (TC 3.A.1.12.1) [Rhizobiaceae bacterium]CAK7256590.1 glycine betaine/proline transport system permease protein [Shinella sp. WSC3-e]MCO5138518.1 proline/glycine betaine ABC transporter permease [Shinella sp.]MCW5706324.1 proline/glycine betaine ABC transporter permease [Shinella sp.]MDC7255355.1 proline/glycine betaine ABC tr